ncbi:hypothetical protein LTS18_004575, partial [Coniosporium uncinatum]
EKTLASLFKISTVGSWYCRNARCPSPHHASTPEANITLSVPLSHKKLSDCINAHFSTETVSIRCEKEDGGCQPKGAKPLPRKRSTRMSVPAPAVLFLQLKRFGHTGHGRSFRAKKDRSRVDIQPKLDLTHLLDVTATKDGAEGEEQKEKTKEKLLYKLSSVVSHSGSSLQSGHYTAVCVAGSGVWKCDDETATKVDARKLVEPGGGWDPYLLAYVKVAE